MWLYDLYISLEGLGFDPKEELEGKVSVYGVLRCYSTRTQLF